MQSTLNRMNFEAKDSDLFFDLTGATILEKIGDALRQWSTRAPFALYFSGHGESLGLVGVDGQIAKLDAIRDLLFATPMLVGTPKLLFLDCCRGSSKDRGVQARSLRGSRGFL